MQSVDPQPQYQIDTISTQGGWIPLDNSIDVWKEKVDLYYFIQQRCDRPAYFWYNFKVYQTKSIDDLVIGEGAFLMYFWICSGSVNPQEWCDTN